MKTWFFYAIIALLLACGISYSQVRVKDVAKVQGLHDTQLIGYGLVVGLQGTGDGQRTMFTVQSVVNMLKNLGIEVPDRRINVKNVAAVMVTSTLKPFVKRGARVDITVSSLGDAKSLEGGTLLMTPLQGNEGEVFAMAQGPISTGGYRVEQERNNMRARNHVAVGMIPDGAVVQKEITTNELSRDVLRFELYNPDFSSAVSLAKAINAKMGKDLAQAEDAATVAVSVPLASQEGGSYYEFISGVEQATFTADRTARVVVNEKTGTIVAGGDVSISQVAVSHGGITIQVKGTLSVSQPPPFSPGETTVIPLVDQQVTESKPQAVVLGPTTNVSDLASALNTLGIAPRDVIAIFEAIKQAGALQAELIVI